MNRDGIRKSWLVFFSPTNQTIPCTNQAIPWSTHRGFSSPHFCGGRRGEPDLLPWIQSGLFSSFSSAISDSCKNKGSEGKAEPLGIHQTTSTAHTRGRAALGGEEQQPVLQHHMAGHAQQPKPSSQNTLELGTAIGNKRPAPAHPATLPVHLLYVSCAPFNMQLGWASL